MKNNIIIGTASWGSKISNAASKEIMHEALRLGFLNYDTAPVYGAGKSQDIISGQEINYPQSLTVTTKFGLVSSASKIPPIILTFMRIFFSSKLIRYARGKFFPNKEIVYASADILDAITSARRKFPNSKLRFCFHEPSLGNLQMVKNESIIDRLRAMFPDVDLGVSVNCKVNYDFCVTHFDKIDFLQMPYDLFITLPTNNNFNIYCYGVVGYLLDNSEESDGIYQNLKTILSHYSESVDDKFKIICDLKNTKRLHALNNALGD